MRRTRNHSLALVLPVVAILWSASPARASTDVTACGQTLAAPGEYAVKHDLDCSGTFGDGIVIAASNVVLHLDGHTIASSDCDASRGISGISVSGASGITIEGGTVHGFNDGIALGAAKSRITNMTVTGACIFGIALSGTGNQVDTSAVTLSGFDGIGIGAATGTLIRNNDISDNARLGVDISNFSSHTVVEDNTIDRNGIADQEQGGVAIFNGTDNIIANNDLNDNFNGIELESPGNTAYGNRVTGSVGAGIFVTSIGSPSAVLFNTVLGSGLVDMLDDSSTCSGNTWIGNAFQTDLAGDVPDGGPAAGCIQ